MKEYTYKIRPVKPFSGNEFIDTGFTGEIKVKIPGYKERMKLVKEQSALGEDFEKISIAAYEVCEKHIASISLSHDACGDISTVEDLTDTQEGVAILFDIYNQILQGWSLNPKTVKP